MIYTENSKHGINKQANKVLVSLSCLLMLKMFVFGLIYCNTPNQISKQMCHTGTIGIHPTCSYCTWGWMYFKLIY